MRQDSVGEIERARAGDPGQSMEIRVDQRERYAAPAVSVKMGVFSIQGTPKWWLFLWLPLKTRKKSGILEKKDTQR